ncbi:SNF2 domain-containing protein ENL1-like [Lolium perenne]|uniref:SNF2 domain-containing protein ENL1-like n=1 Tax=Lolium perenne TaxID=4522 RepID=UPI0021F6130D|nr:SNF2 domain-containing protein ENL1-like [Lolium perenne]
MSTGHFEYEDDDIKEVVVEYHDTHAAVSEELPDLEMEATVGSGKPPYNLQDVGSSSLEMKESTSTGDCEDDDDVKEVLEYHDTDAAEEQDRLPDFEMVDTVASSKPPYKLPTRIFNKLYPHQREGLIWLWSLRCRGTGGILGDDMGLGKTMQVSAFLAGLFHSGLIRRVLVVTPNMVLTHWIKELSVVGLRHKISTYYGPKKDVRHYELQHVFKEGGILLTTYDMVRINYKQIRGDFYDEEEEGKMWNYVILDEAHLIKNPKAQRSQCLLEIPCVHRIAISGTPIQNNLKEMWSIFSFCCPEVLPDKDEFRKKYEVPIYEGNDKSARSLAKDISSDVAKELRERIKPYFLRRTKSEVFLETGLTDDKQLPKKNELVIWLKLTDRQRQLYKAFLKCELVHLAASRGNPLAAITVLKKICDHPQLVTKRDEEMDMAENNDQEMEMAEKMAMNLGDMPRDDGAVEVGPEVSCKLSFILALLRNLLEEGHHVLIFSQTHKMLNLIQEAILLEGYSFSRMDGNTEISERERIVKDFQEGLGAQIFLLTTKVGGIGLTLTKAARVIVVDPDWNPSTDDQSIDRVYRIGQTQDVIVYRLITSATVEEKIYKTQVLKGALFRAATEKNEQPHYFSQSEIQDPFSLPEQGFDVSLTQKQLQEEHGYPLDIDAPLREHIEFLEQQPGTAGVGYHSLLFSKTEVLPMFTENNALGRGAHAKPKDECFTATTCTNSEIPEEMNRLTETFASTTLEPRLSDCADKIVNALDNGKLTVGADSSPSSSKEMIY